MDDAAIDAKLAAIPKVDYERISERMFVEMIYVNYEDGADKDRYCLLYTSRPSRKALLISRKEICVWAWH